MELERAQAIAAALVEELEPYCQKMTMAGSIRRRRPLVNDIDLVLIPRTQGRLAVKLHEMGCRFGGAKLKRFQYRGASVDIYIATEDTFPMLLLVRTGSAAFNRDLAMRAKAKLLHFAADGRGILKDGQRVAWRSEEEILGALGLPYIEPSRRERL
jgi:DNA polymerase (family 10)